MGWPRVTVSQAGIEMHLPTSRHRLYGEGDRFSPKNPQKCLVRKQARFNACQAQRILTLILQVYTSQVRTFLSPFPSLSPSIPDNGEIKNLQWLARWRRRSDVPGRTRKKKLTSFSLKEIGQQQFQVQVGGEKSISFEWSLKFITTVVANSSNSRTLDRIC